MTVHAPHHCRIRTAPRSAHAVLLWLLAALLLGTAGCAGAGQNGALGPDAPVPPDEPRAELRLRVELPSAQDCEEAFDLALYANRAVELIEWDEHKGDCEERFITIRYLSRQLTAEQLLARVRELAASAQPAAPAAAAAKPSPETHNTTSHE